MAFVWFILAAAVTVFAAIKLSNYADVLSTKTAMGGLLVGTLLLAGATSLPEVTTSVSAVLIGNPDIAIGNVVGSNMFNLFIFACFDLAYRRHHLLELAGRNHLYTAGTGLVLMAVTYLSLQFRPEWEVFGVGLDSIALVILYAIGMVVVGRISRNEAPTPAVPVPDTAVTSDEGVDDGITVRRAVIGFSLAALVIMGAGTVLSIMGDRIAVITGLGSSFVGSFLIAATTSLPEAVSVFVALRARNVNLALGSILGSNMFNMLIIFLSDLFYRDGAVLSVADPSHRITALVVMALSAVLLLAIARKKTASHAAYMVPSILIVIGYFIASYLMFQG
ncbi:Inner membrane protein yrbG [Bhargavaea cecembensis DSE10]|uniref:Inner membrane protein yrbG n=1 Tax=Bhargavaea cecembensis DSE10 TaxID=1235279 RepID=M7NCC2_9BACL|nr:sodium:calcium antiporter [Bhargavaea cecembensis]EMR06223.1 Inner membrane protein yrbG [Bhargavaea cecembensis DSE10]